MGAVSNGFSIYLPYIRDDFGLTNAQTSTLVTLRLLVAFFCMLVIGKYYDFFDIRAGASIASAFAALTFIVYAFSTGYAGFASAAALSGIAYGMGSMVPVSILMNRWFDEHKALAISICSAGSGMGSIILPPVITGLLSSLSMRTVFLLEAAFIACCTILIFVLTRNYPQDMGLTRLGENREKLKSADPASYKAQSSGSSLKGGVWAAACIGCLLMGAQGNPGISHIPVLYTSAGFTAVFAATLMSIIGAALTLGKIVYGELTDKIGGLKSSVAFLVLLTAGNAMCCLAGTGNSILSLLAVLALGVGYSASTIGPSVWAGDLSSEYKFAKTIRNFQVSYSLGALITASIPGILADRFDGSYIPAYVLFTIITVIGSLLIIAAYKKSRP